MKLSAAGVLLLAAATLAVACSGSNGGGTPTSPNTPGTPTTPTVPQGASPLVTSMYQQLPTYLKSALTDMQNLLPNNPQSVSQINAKIAILQRASLAADMSAGRTFAERTATSTDGRAIQFAVIFPEERLRSEATDALERLTRTLPVLETFLKTPWPPATVHLWYGFVVGNSGGNAVLDMEDRTSYTSRGVAMPYDAILDHELAHTYIGNETLNQFLEMYAFNRLAGSTTTLASWSHTRGYTGMSDSNKDSALVLDVYGMLGHDAMSRAYQRVYGLRPPYGQPLAAAVIQVFVDEAATDVKTQVAAKLGKVVF